MRVRSFLSVIITSLCGLHSRRGGILLHLLPLLCATLLQPLCGHLALHALLRLLSCRYLCGHRVLLGQLGRSIRPCLYLLRGQVTRRWRAATNTNACTRHDVRGYGGRLGRRGRGTARRRRRLRAVRRRRSGRLRHASSRRHCGWLGELRAAVGGHGWRCPSSWRVIEARLLGRLVLKKQWQRAHAARRFGAPWRRPLHNASCREHAAQPHIRGIACIHLFMTFSPLACENCSTATWRERCSNASLAWSSKRACVVVEMFFGAPAAYLTTV